jgi:hypothetical protein
MTFLMTSQCRELETLSYGGHVRADTKTVDALSTVNELEVVLNILEKWNKNTTVMQWNSTSKPAWMN